jgi:hypothetical protein
MNILFNLKNGKHIIVLTMLFLCIHGETLTQAPDTAWTKTFGGSSDDYGISVQQTSDGGYIIAGWTESFGAGSRDVYLIKTDANGDTLFTKTFGGTGDDWGESVQQTSDGGYIIAGATKSFGANRAVYLIKTDANGNTLYTKTFGGSGNDWGSSVQQTSDGGYIITGYTTSFGAFWSDVYLIKTDANGDTLFTKTIGGSNTDVGYSVQQTSDGGYIITGYTYSFGAGYDDVYLIKTDANGDTLFTKTFGGSGSEYGNSVQQTSDGGYIIAGWTASFGAGSDDIYLIKTDANGDTLFTKTFGGSSIDWGYSVQQTSDGGYIIAGRTKSFGAGNNDVYLIKTDANGNTLFTKTFGRSGDDVGFSVQQTSDGGYIITGYTESFGAVYGDVYLIKLKPENPLSFSSSSLSFGDVPLSGSKTDSVVVSNAGNATLNVTSVSSSSSVFVVSPSNFFVPSSQSKSIRVTFTPTSATSYNEKIIIEHNATGSPDTITLSGTGQSRVTGFSTNVGRFSSGIPASNWVLLSIPYKPDNSVRNIIESQLPGSGKTKVYTLENGRYVDRTASGSSYHLTDGFWLKTVAKSSAFDLNFGSGEIIGDASYSITIPNGWSFIGSPFYPQEASWSPVNTVAGTSGIRVYKYAHENKQWSGPLDPSVEKLKPFGGYAVWNGTGNSATFTFERGTSPTPFPEFQNGDGWFAKIEIGNSVMRIGQHRNANNGNDYYDYPMAPVNPEMKSNDSYLAGKLWSDVRSQQMNGLKRWKVYINPKTSREIKLKEVFNLPSDWKIVVSGIPSVKEQELNEGEVISLPKNISVPFVAEILVGKSDLLENEKPKEFSLQQNYPNPFNPQTSIELRVSSYEFVTLKIYNMLGQEIAILFDGNLETGNYNFIWEGKDNSGNVVGSGIYFARLTTSNFTKTIKMELVR